jgi:hypothetical protein
MSVANCKLGHRARGRKVMYTRTKRVVCLHVHQNMIVHLTNCRRENPRPHHFDVGVCVSRQAPKKKKFGNKTYKS